MPESIDFKEEKDVPTLAERLYHFYNSDALGFLMDAYSKVLEFLPELYPQMSHPEKDKARQIITLEAMMKFCQAAENLAAIAVGFKQTYDDEKQEILGIFSTLGEYNVGQIIDFYKHVKNRDLRYFAKFIGYPPLPMQSKRPRQFLEMSCQNVKDEMIEVAGLYELLRPLYDAQKHGYRISFGRINETGADAFAYFDQQGNQKVIAISADDFKKIKQRASSCVRIIELIFDCHKARANYEAKGSISGAEVHVSIFRRRNQEKPNKEDLEIRYPTRGERLKMIREEANLVYATFKAELEENHKGKIVAIDIDGKEIVAMDYEVEKLVEELRKSKSTGRIVLRRVGQNGNIGIEMY